MKKITLEQLLTELEQARVIAADDRKPAAMIAATMGKAKLSGLDNGEVANQTAPQPVQVIIDTVDARKH